MRLLKMSVLRWKALTKKPHVWLFILLSVLASLIPATAAKYHSDSRLPIALVNEDNGVASYDFERYMARYDRLLVFKLDRDTALRYMAMGRLEAVYIVTAGFTDAVQHDNYKGLITMVTAPASSAAVVLSETVVNSALMVWMVETALYKVDGFLQEEHIALSAEGRQALHREFNTLLLSGSTIMIRQHIPAPAQTGATYEPLLRAVGWYGAFVALFVITSAGWVSETGRLALGDRLRLKGYPPLTTLLGSSVTVISLAVLGYLLAGTAASLTAGFKVTLGLTLLPVVLLYMLGLIGITLVLCAFFEKTLQLMLIAPVFTIMQGVLCGMLFQLPNWAGILTAVSTIFPGRLFMLAADALLQGTPLLPLLQLLFVSCGWLLLGLLTALRRYRRPSQVIS